MSCPRTTPPNPYVLRVGKANKSAKYDPVKVGQYPRKYGLDPNKPKDNIQSTKTKKLSDLEHIPWKCKAHVSGLSSPETAAMETIIKNIMHFCCHTTKQMLYECALKDGNFVNFARKGLLTVLKQERAWCMWTSVSHPGKKVRCNWTDEETTAHAMIRSVTHLHPIIIRYLISEFLQDRTVDELQKTLRLCLYWEINYYRDKMNNWDCRIYKYICQNSDVCIQIVNAFRRLGKDIVILEWMSDWTALLYFCQYERGPFYYFLHPLDTPNSKVLRSYKGEKQTTVCCTDSIVSLSSLTERDYLDLIKEAWDSEISYTQVDVTDTQILKIEKFRKCVEAHFLHTQHEFWKVQDRIANLDSVNHFSRTNICLPSKFSQKAALIHARSKHSKTGVGRETRCGCCPGEAGSPQRGTAHRPPRSSEPLALRSSIFFQHASGASKVSADARSARGTSAPSPPSLRRAHALRCRVVHAGERTCECVADTARDRARRYAPAGCACAALSSNDLPHLQTFSADRAHDGPAAVRADDFADC